MVASILSSSVSELTSVTARLNIDCTDVTQGRIRVYTDAARTQIFHSSVMKTAFPATAKWGDFAPNTQYWWALVQVTQTSTGTVVGDLVPAQNSFRTNSSGTITDSKVDVLSGGGFVDGTLRDRQTAELISLGATSGSYADRCKAAGVPQFP